MASRYSPLPEWAQNAQRRRSSEAVKKVLPLLCLLAVLVAAFEWTYSTGGFLVTGLGLALLLDKQVFRLCPWSGPARWTKDAELLPSRTRNDR
jgi:hypothetical protein